MAATVPLPPPFGGYKVPEWLSRFAGRVGWAAAYHVYLGFAVHMKVGEDFRETYGRAARVNVSAASILGLPAGSAKGDLALRPDFVQNVTKEVYELKSGVLGLIPGTANALATVSDYIDLLNREDYGPSQGYHHGISYAPFGNHISLAPYTVGYAYVYLEAGGSLVWYPDSINAAILATLAAGSPVSVRLPGRGGFTIPDLATGPVKTLTSLVLY